MKVASLLLLPLAVSGFVTPRATTFSRSTTFLSESEEAEDAPEWTGAQAASALTAGIKTELTVEDVAKILPHVRNLYFFISYLESSIIYLSHINVL